MEQSNQQPQDIEGLMKVSQQTLMSVSGMSQQMGLVLDKLTIHDERIAGLQGEIDTIKHTETVDRAQRRRIKRAIKNRVYHKLGVPMRSDERNAMQESVYKTYFPGFISKIYTDARNHSRLGDPIDDTLRVDYDEVISYIDSWEPECPGGVEGRMAELDALHNAKNLSE